MIRKLIYYIKDLGVIWFMMLIMMCTAYIFVLKENSDKDQSIHWQNIVIKGYKYIIEEQSNEIDSLENLTDNPYTIVDHMKIYDPTHLDADTVGTIVIQAQPKKDD